MRKKVCKARSPSAKLYNSTQWVSLMREGTEAKLTSLGSIWTPWNHTASFRLRNHLLLFRFFLDLSLLNHGLSLSCNYELLTGMRKEFVAVCGIVLLMKKVEASPSLAPIEASTSRAPIEASPSRSPQLYFSKKKIVHTMQSKWSFFGCLDSEHYFRKHLKFITSFLIQYYRTTDHISQ